MIYLLFYLCFCICTLVISEGAEIATWTGPGFVPSADIMRRSNVKDTSSKGEDVDEMDDFAKEETEDDLDISTTPQTNMQTYFNNLNLQNTINSKSKLTDPTIQNDYEKLFENENINNYNHSPRLDILQKLEKLRKIEDSSRPLKMTVQQAMELEPNWLFLNGQLKTIDEIRNSKMNNNLLSIHGNNLPTFSDQNNKNCKCIVLLAGRQQFQNSAIIQKYMGPILPISKDLSCICKSNPYVESLF